ncbi:MAG: 30S ribosome-binding factor RbfA [Clostridia bacterium]|nr:30S ribosome-binding factor RbfA [Clostridia bacterium]MBR4110480.1 30S ribosome-binding factor RbfA [Clostridia bacterium]
MERTDRIEEEIKKIVSVIIDRELKDPRLDGLISVTKVTVSKDLKYCKIFVSMLGTKDTAAAMQALESGAGYVRREVGSKVRMHSTPEIKFELDDSMEYGAHIQNIINGLDIKHDEEDIDESEENA